VCSSDLFDMARFLAGDIAELSGMTSVKVPTRRDSRRPEGQQDREVENDDAFAALVRFTSGATGVLEANRVATGARTDFSFEVTGSLGAVKWTFGRLSELELYLPEEDRRAQGFRRIRMAVEHPFQGAFIPSPGHPIGYPDTKVIEIHSFLDGLARNEAVSPNIDDYVAIARAMAGVPERRWVTVS